MMRLPVFVVAIVIALRAFAQDWPQWRGPDRSGHVPQGAAVPTSLKNDLKSAWEIPAGFGLASPVVAGGKVLFLDIQDNQEMLRAADAASGKVLWSTAIDEGFKDQQSQPGPRCTPLVDGDRVYAQSCRGELKCLGVSDGKVIWRTNFAREFGAVFIGEKGKAEGATRHGNTGSPVIDGEKLIAQVGGKGATLVAFEKKTGKVLWKTQDDVPAYAAPVVAELGGVRQVISYVVEGVIGVDSADGKLLWRTPVKTSLGRHVTTPIIAGEVVIVSSHQAGLIAIKVSKSGGAFQAERAWTSKENAINFASPVVAGNHLYGVGPQKNLICVDIATGKQAWSQAGYFGNSAHAGMIVMGKNILMLTDKGELILFEANPGAFKEVGRAQACGNNWCNPAFSAGRLYFRDAGTIKCVELK